MSNFSALKLSAPLLRVLDSEGYKEPTAIQAQSIPSLLEGKDLIGLAQTGSGKTAAFVLPLIDKLSSEKPDYRKGRARALILAPTRELAQQIGTAVQTFSKSSKLRTAIVYGGAPFGKQLSQLKGGVDILVATPGRLMDHSRRGSVKFDATQIFVLDEADRMLDMGFIPDVREISAAIKKDHQTILFSATMNKAIEKLANELLTKPVRVNVTPKESVSPTIKHSVLHVSIPNKKLLLRDILENNPKGQCIVFTKTKRNADKISKELAKSGLKTDAIHGDRNQRQRQRTLNAFRNGKVRILVATDVAARGIDVPGIERVINFDLPLEPEAYIHRVGRTGRNGADGIAQSLCTPEDIGLLYDIERLLKAKIDIDVNQAFHQDPPERRSKGSNKKRPSSKGRPRGNTKRPRSRRPKKKAA